jgi:hypothetical protein
MAVHNLHENLLRALATGGCVLNDPGTGGTIDIYGKDRMVARGFGAGTYILPTLDDVYIGVSLKVVADAAQTWTNATPVTIATLAAGETGNFTFTGETGSEWSCVVEAATASVEINTAADVPISDAGSYYTATQVEGALQEIAGLTLPLASQANTTYNNTDGTGTLTAAAIFGGLITRTGETAAYTDTTADAADIIALVGSAASLASWPLVIKNTVAFNQTLSAGSSVVLAGLTVIPPNSIGHFLVSYSAADEITITGLYATPQCVLKNVNYTTITEAASITAAAGTLTGAETCVYTTTGSVAGTALTTRTAAEMFADTPNAHIGLSWVVRIISDGANTTTLTAGSNVTITGTATVATNTWREFRFIFTSATALTAQVIGMGTVDSTT